MIRTQPLTGNSKVEVAFVLREASAVPLSVVGDFNDWDPMVTPMTPGGEGLEAKVTVDAGRRYAFRYLGVDGNWFNDDAAHTYEPGPFGSDNCVVDVTDAIGLIETAVASPAPAPADAATAPAPKKPRARKPRAT